MMKSFFKKLAFVMALAMVVTAMAPAATASAAADLGIALQTAASKEEVKTADNVAVDATVDYKYYGAPKNYKELNPTWASSKEDVATVDKNGVVTGKKDGVTVISITLDNGQKGEIEITVGKGDKVDNSFTVTQTTDTLAELTFANKAITQAEVEAGLSVEWVVVDDFKATQPFQVVSVKEGVATINVYGFTDGVKYVFTYADEEPVVLDATIGDVASIEVKAYADAACSAELEHVAYVGQDAYIKYTLKNAKGVDITDVALKANPSAYVEFKLGAESTTGEYWLNDMTGTASSPEGKIWFAAANKNVKVTAKYITGKFDSTTGLPVEGPQSLPYTVYSTNAPAYRLVSKTGFTLNGDWDHPTNVIALDDEVGSAKTVWFKFKDSNKADVKSNVGTAEGTFSYKSTVPSVAFVDANSGNITTNTVGTTTVLCYFTPKATATNLNPTPMLVAAETITVAAKRAVAQVDPAKRAVVVSTATQHAFNTTSFTVEVKDQLGAYIDSADIKVERNNATLPSGLTAPTVSIAKTAKGKYTVSVAGAAANVGEATSYLFTYEIKATGAATQTFTVTVRKPIYSNGNLVVSGYDIVTNGVTDIKTEDTAAKTLTATVNVQSNAVSVEPVVIAKNPGKDYVAGAYYYTVTKDGKDITKDNTSLAGTTINVPLTTVATNAAVSGNNVVNKTTSGAGNYVITVFQAVGATAGATTQALSTIQTKTVNVADTQKTVSFVAKKNASVSNTGNVVTMALEAFAFKFNGNDFGGSVGATTRDGIIVTVDAKTPATTFKTGDVVFVRSITFYVPTTTGGSTYTTNTITINDYITVK